MSKQFVSGPATATGEGPGGESDSAVLLLDAQGIINYCSRTAESIFGYAAPRLQGVHVSRVLPELSNTELMPEGRVNPRLAFLCHCGRRFRAQRQDGAHFDSELHVGTAALGHAICLRLLIRDVSRTAPIATAI